MNGFAIWPQSAAKGIAEEILRLDIDALAFTAGSEEENKSDKFAEGELAIAGKILRQSLVMVTNSLGDKVQKRWDDMGKLA
jgi:hypothetical protein